VVRRRLPRSAEALPITRILPARRAIIAGSAALHSRGSGSTSAAKLSRHSCSVTAVASVCGAGCYTAPAALELYAEAFEAAGALDRLEAGDRVAATRIVGTEAARSQLLDLEVPGATTDFATARTLERIGIALLGQLNRHRGAILDLLA